MLSRAAFELPAGGRVRARLGAGPHPGLGQAPTPIFLYTHAGNIPELKTPNIVNRKPFSAGLFNFLLRAYNGGKTHRIGSKAS